MFNFTACAGRGEKFILVSLYLWIWFNVNVCFIWFTSNLNPIYPPKNTYSILGISSLGPLLIELALAWLHLFRLYPFPQECVKTKQSPRWFIFVQISFPLPESAQRPNCQTPHFVFELHFNSTGGPKARGLSCFLGVNRFRHRGHPTS